MYWVILPSAADVRLTKKGRQERITVAGIVPSQLLKAGKINNL